MNQGGALSSNHHERMARAHSFFRDLSSLPIPQGKFSAVGQLNDCQRLF